MFNDLALLSRIWLFALIYVISVLIVEPTLNNRTFLIFALCPADLVDQPVFAGDPA